MRRRTGLRDASTHLWIGGGGFDCRECHTLNPNQLWISGPAALTVFEVDGNLPGSVPLADDPLNICIPDGFTAYVTTR